VEIGRATMCNWLVKVADRCAPLMALLRQDILSGPLANADETTLQVLKEPGRDPTDLSYIWTFRGGLAERPALEFVYDETRSSRVAKDYFRNYQGGVQTDGYDGYNFLDKQPGIVHYGCWAHARRGFDDVLKAMGKSSNPHKRRGSAAEEALGFIAEFYQLETKARKQGVTTPAALREWRQTYTKPKVLAFKKWLDEKVILTPPKGLLGKAISYTLSQWLRLERIFDNGFARLDNNVAENAIRPFVVGRKNWLFSGTPDGARASATLYSLVETAKANKLSPYWYLRALFERLPFASTPDDFKALLPQYIELRSPHATPAVE